MGKVSISVCLEWLRFFLEIVRGRPSVSENCIHARYREASQEK